MKSCISQGSPEKQTGGIYRNIERDSLWGIGSQNYGGWYVLYSVCKLEAQQSNGIILVQTQRPENQGSHISPSPILKVWYLRANGLSPCQSPKVREPRAFMFKGRRQLSLLILPLPLCSICAFFSLHILVYTLLTHCAETVLLVSICVLKGLSDALVRRILLPQHSFQILIYSRNILTDTSRIMFYQVAEHSYTSLVDTEN